VAEERDQVTPPVAPVVTPDYPATSLTATELDDVDVPRDVSTAGLEPAVSGDRIDETIPPGVTAAAGTGTFAPESDDPAVIREQIERTREDMSQTINELQERLSPQHLAQQARDSVREATVGRVQQLVGSAADTAAQVGRRAQEAAGPVVEQVRERPVPIALAGAGVGLVWYLMRRASSRQTWSRDDMYDWDDDTVSTRDYRRGYGATDYGDNRESGRWQGDGGWMRALRNNPVPASIAAASIGYLLWSRRSSLMADDTRSPAYAGYDEDYYGTSTTERVGDTARELGRQARETAAALGDQARGKASALGEQARETATAISGQVTDTVRSARRRAGQVSRQTSTQFDHWMQDNPLAVGIAAVAAGAVVGLTLPRTHVENQTMGASRDALIDRAGESAQQLKEQVRDKVQEVAGDLTSTPSSTSSTSSTSAPGV
jgi:ElaB/YqjD/DUF883 family membrane-anchored ribosome-binding protein